MCLAIPGTIRKIHGTNADIDFGGLTAHASLRLVENAAVGDRVLVHAGFVMHILASKEGEELEKLVDETLRSITP